MPYAANTSSAYDLSSFAEKPKGKQLRKEDLRVVKTPKQFLASVVTVKNLTVFLMAVTMVCVMIYNNVRLTEVTNNINALQDDLKELNSEYVKMESMKGANLSDRTIAELAENELGLKRVDKYQMEYIYLYQDDKIEANGEKASEGLAAKAKVSINGAIAAIKEYLDQ